MKHSTFKHSGISSPGIISGLMTAFFISLAAAISSLLLGGFIHQGTLFTLIIHGSAIAYLIYLLRKSNARIGRIVVFSSWACISLLSWFFEVALIQQILIQAGMIWLIRSLYFHASLVSALMDFVLVAIALAAGAWSMVNTGSIAVTLWSFFLVQSLFCWIPDLTPKATAQPHRSQQESNFQSAHRAALDAVQKLTQS